MASAGRSLRRLQPDFAASRTLPSARSTSCSSGATARCGPEGLSGTTRRKCESVSESGSARAQVEDATTATAYSNRFTIVGMSERPSQVNRSRSPVHQEEVEDHEDEWQGPLQPI
jgi:hypothetical protein